MNDLIKRLRDASQYDKTGTINEAADKLEEQALALGVERAWVEKLEKDLAAAKQEAYKTAVSDFCLQFGVKTVEELEHKIDAAQKEIEELKKIEALFEISLDNWRENEGILREQIAAAQAQIVKYREALEWMLENGDMYDYHIQAAQAALAQPQDTSALDEAIRRGKIEVLREYADRVYDFESQDAYVHWVVMKIKELERK